MKTGLRGLFAATVLACPTMGAGQVAASSARLDPASITVPALEFDGSPEISENFDKYYYFHRSQTDFDVALADIEECDSLSRGLVSSYAHSSAPAAGLGGMLGVMLVEAVAGSAEVRAHRRVNMRRCMSFKGYQRYGLPKEIWAQFNFEEGFGDLADSKREVFLRQQAKIASVVTPVGKALTR